MKSAVKIVLFFLFVYSVCIAQKQTPTGQVPANVVVQQGGSPVTSVNPLPVVIEGGAGSGGTSSNFGAAFPASGTAIGLQPSGGGNMVPGLADASGFFEVDCKSGCSGSADTTASGTLSSACADGSINSCGANSTVSISMAGVNSASFTLPSGNTLAATLKADCSTDGGTTWFITNVRLAATSIWGGSVAVSSTNQGYEIEVPGGCSNIRVRASAVTSGTATASVRGVTQPELLPGWVGVAGNSLPPFVGQIGGSDGSNLRALKTDTSGDLNVIFPSSQSVTISGTPTVTANAGTGTFTVSGTVTANAGTNLNTSALALDTSVNGILLSQGSTTSGEKGPLLQGAVTTAAPSYTTAQTSPISLDTSGNLRTSVNNTVTVSGTVTANAGTGTFAVQDATVEGAISSSVMQVNDKNWGGSALGAPTNWATAPSTSTAVIGENSELFVGQNAVSATAPVPVSATAAANASGNPIFTESVTGSTTAVTQTTASNLNATVTPAGSTNWTNASVGSNASSAPTSSTEAGLIAATSYPTAVSNGQEIGAMGDKAGRTITWSSCPRDIIGKANLANTTPTSATSFIAAGGSGVFNDITALIVTNRSSTPFTLTLTDNGSGGNSFTVNIANNQGAGLVIPFNPPLIQGTSNAAWDVLESTSAAFDINAVYCEDK